MKYEKGNGKYQHINERTFNFAIRVINLCKSLPKDEANRILINQVIRSATSVGANLEEASGAHTKAEFINCTNIARREARETDYWLRMIHEINSKTIKNRMTDLLKESDEIVSILVVSVKKLQSK